MSYIILTISKKKETKKKKTYRFIITCESARHHAESQRNLCCTVITSNECVNRKHLHKWTSDYFEYAI